MCFPVLRSPFILIRLSELLSFEPSGPCPSHLEVFQTGNHSAFEGCWRQKPLAIVGSVHVSARSSASRFCFSPLLHSVPVLFFLEHSWGLHHCSASV